MPIDGRRVKLTDKIDVTAFTASNSYSAIASTLIDTWELGQTVLAFRVAATTSGATAKLSGSMNNSAWVDHKTIDENGTVRATTEVTIAAAADEYLIITPGESNGAKIALRYYQLFAKNTVSGSTASVACQGLAK